MIVEVEELKSKRNQVSQTVAKLKREKKDADHLIKETKEVSGRIKKLDETLRAVEEELEIHALSIPNVPHESTPVGETEDDNVEIRNGGISVLSTFEPKPHWDWGRPRYYWTSNVRRKLQAAVLSFIEVLGASLNVH